MVHSRLTEQAGSLQHAWLRRDLAAIDRAATPWVIVMMHAPWYNSNSGDATRGYD